MTSTNANPAVRAGEKVVRRMRSAIDPLTTMDAERSPDSGWLAVTVMCDPGAIHPDALPAPLAELGDQIDVRVTPAPADKGTELRVRLRRQGQTASGSGPSSSASSLSGQDPQADLRGALRRAKQLIEVGEVLAVDPAPHGERPSSPGGLLLEAWTRVAPKGGVR